MFSKSALAPETMLKAARNFHQTAFHRISCVDKCTTITTLHMNWMTLSIRLHFHSESSRAFVNTASSMEYHLAEFLAASSMDSGARENLKTLPHKRSPKVKRPHPKFMILKSFYQKNNFLPNELKISDILSMITSKLWFTAVAFFLGHPV